MSDEAEIAYREFGAIVVNSCSTERIAAVIREYEGVKRKHSIGEMVRAFRMVGLSGGQQESCPDCGGVIVLEEGCLKCLTCGFSSC